MALLTTTSETATYSKIPVLHKNYFVLLCRTRGVSSGFSVRREDPEGKTCNDTYTITITQPNAYSMMQKVFEDANG